MITPVIQSERLRLDAVTGDDTALVFDYCQDPELQRYTRIPVPYSRMDAEMFTGMYASGAALTPQMCLWAIRAEGEFVGTIELRFDASPSAELGYWLGSPHRGRGIMTEAVGLVSEYALDREGFALQRLRWDAVAGNQASGIVARRNGFTFAGEVANHIVIRGEAFDAWTAELKATDSRDVVDGWPL